MNIKRYLLKILLLLVLVGSVANADILVVPFYEIHEKSVYYRTENGLEKLQNADAKTFEIFKESRSFGRDKNNVYYLGDKLNKIDPKTFEVVEGYYITMFKDKNGIYTFGKNYDKLKIINFKENGIDIDFNDFKVISSENPTIYRNKNDVYFQKGGKIYPIKNVDAKTFEKINGRSYLDNKYYRDKNDVYYFSSDKILKLENADRNSVNELSKNILRDKNNVYFENQQIKGLDVNSFKVIYENRISEPENLIKDKNGVYYIDENKKTLIKFKNNEIDIESFGIANKMLDDYFKDKNNVYYLEDYKLHRLDDLDIETYQNIFMTRYKKDKNNLYFKWKKVKNVNPNDVEIIENDFIKIKDTLYEISNFEEKEVEILPLAVDVKSFEYIDNKYYKDKTNIYYNKNGKLKKIEDVNFKSFGILEENSYFGKDKNNIYYKGDKLEKIDRNSFRVLNESYDNSIIKDKNGIYILTKESSIKIIKIDKNIKNIDFNNFEEITNYPYVFKDKNSVYTLNTDDDKTVTVFSFEKNDYKLNKLNNINPKKFDMIEFNYFKDDKNIFYFSDKEKIMKKIENADVESFEVLDDDYSKDKNSKYYHGERIK
ncbi:DKNYY domain-containing protein [Leptotrichia sp. oral taxon 218]|uniref:DKNYY domain-containing protein n=1 Tax=Leptotrichia sp. oral taxon 218 TaxID=712361 RepID=UPI001B8C6A4F|nr:DKNYY domain-containing protein [Leptotrichia sp. oral taxon 218]QUB94858.1 DKNYY domain-containing protein [Leptotrichia sp. oral taxon 218]